ncbi:cytochrome C oxidase subunit II [Paenibacillus sp. TRM 82003]|nr:cytochrome C oxidase subunit II [Paenibacillus sp. TRM 82003]
MSLLLIAALSACGGGGSAAPAVEPNGNTVDLAVQATNFEFNETEFRVKAGDTVNLAFASPEGMHGLGIHGLDVMVKDGGTVTFVAPPGEYEMYCTIMCGQGHSQMKAKLIVE